MREKFDLTSVAKRFLRAENWGRNDFSRLMGSEAETLMLCELAMAQFKKEETLVHLSAPCRVVGDIQGQYYDLMHFLYMPTGLPKSKKFPLKYIQWLFLGNYIGHGKQSLETITLMFALKAVYKHRFVMLRGNHETKSVNEELEFKEECEKKFGSLTVWEKFNEAFSWMPLACLIGGRVLGVHGGISNELTSREDIIKIKRPLVDVSTCKLAEDLLWADPMEDNELVRYPSKEPAFAPNVKRGRSVTFNREAVTRVCELLDVRLIVRSHQMYPKGFYRFTEHTMITIFSAPRYKKESDNEGASLLFNENGVYGFHLLAYKRPLKNDDGKFDDDLFSYL